MVDLELPPRSPVSNVLRVIARRRWLFGSLAVATSLLGFAAVFSLTPSYTATATILVSLRNSDPLAPIGTQGEQGVQDDQLTTEAGMLQSRDIAAAVVQQLHIDEVAPAPHGIQYLLCSRLGIQSLCVPSAPPPSLQGRVDAFLAGLKVIPEDRSRILDVTYTSKSPRIAALAANAVVENYQRLGLSNQSTDLNRTTGWLDQRTDELRQRWLEAQRKADTLSVTKELGESSTGSAGATNVPLIDQRINETANMLTQAQGELAAAQARSDALQGAAGAGGSESLLTLGAEPLIVQDAGTLAQLETTRAQEVGQLGPDHPQMRALDSQIEGARRRLSLQTSVALRSIQSNLVAKQSQVTRLQQSLQALQNEARTKNAPNADYRLLSQEAESARSVYETFLIREKEVAGRDTLLAPPVTFVSHAEVPDQATFPKIPRLLVASVLLGLVVGAAVVFAVEHFSTDFADIAAFKAAVSLPVLAVIPTIVAARGRAAARHVVEQPFSRASEAVRGLVAMISLATREEESQVVAITSAGASEGKSTLAIWIALTMARTGEKVLVIDGDHRRGSLFPGARRPSTIGLTDLISGQATLAQVLLTDPVSNIDFIPAGTPTSHPLLGGDIRRLRSILRELKTSYKLIVLDTPPLLAMNEGLIYGRIADQTLFVARWRHTSRNAVTVCLKRLQQAGVSLPGVVLAMVEPKTSEAYGDDFSRREIRLLGRLYGQ